MNVIQERLKEISDKKYQPHERGEKSVKVVREYFLDMGFSATYPKNVSANGTDLTVLRGSEAFRIEVKTVRKTQGAWRTGKVLTPSDDFVASVFPSGKIHLDTMKSHLSQCGKDGTRYFTALGKVYE